jgi:hypothetical protein
VASHARINTCFLLLITELNEQKNLATLASKKLSNLIVSKERQKKYQYDLAKRVMFSPDSSFHQKIILLPVLINSQTFVLKSPNKVQLVEEKHN